MIRLIAVISAGLLVAGCFTQPPAPAVDKAALSQSRNAVAMASAAPAQAGPGFYTVKRGDTLFRIALDHGVDYRDIANWNNLANPAAIKEGQVLRVAAEIPEAGAVKPVATTSGVEARPLGTSASVVAAATTGLKREPRGGKEPYSDEAYARLNKLPVEAEKAPEKPVEKATESKPETVAVGPDELAWAWPTGAKVTAAYSEAGNKGLDFAGKAGDAVLAAGDGKVVYAGSGLRGYGELVIIKHNATYLSAYGHNRKILVKEGQMVTRGQKIAEMGNTDAETVKLHFEIRKQGKPVDPAQFLPKR